MSTNLSPSRPDPTAPLKIVVTGAAGFVGSHVVEALSTDLRAIVVATDAGGETRLEELGQLSRVSTRLVDLREPSALDSLVDKSDVIVHLAAVRTQASSERPRDAHDVNVGAVYDLLTAARAAGTRRFVFGSSHTVYGSFSDPHREPFTEDQPWPLAGLNMYAATKLAAEAYLEAFAASGGPDYLALRLGTVYGPRSSPGGNASLMTDLIAAVNAGSTPTIPWASNARHGLIHVADVAEAICRAVFSDATGMPINVSGIPRTSSEIYGSLAQLAGADPASIVFDESRTRHQLVSQKRMQEVLDFTPRVELEEGLRSVIDWAGISTRT
ncbi:NAD(P)-dependent oxidoreductase [Rhodococcus sp. 06-156-3C]|uniref:NAD-dependent epimerase/dehydratase family protein n=1 Tax=Nocardiaceae TaxID=85025 RepID=UPI000691FAE4|nr:MULTISPECIES: NAD(P)-dependent oxidoreductase [Rhodococcus]OZD11626.1 NAD(P)-dependent oxidoreductase [Rhodococcus sp. 06-156-4C]OZD15468.1 NAD(P)-dependent oxidoreductase [Rhodococcus sp. 06-156-4a]OZD23634.1 NAD(P)-dependent oxidoreductase [Rhodococcus sp. 06-156-3C]OZD27294.1 NAD(P)-dependent oxidoreductase [Rhodococcus sp. 06-156-3b]OZD31310.1 NAD(P)-dependent oxidoreductase [Rhodococcus sp. 06-156-3]